MVTYYQKVLLTEMIDFAYPTIEHLKHYGVDMENEFDRLYRDIALCIADADFYFKASTVYHSYKSPLCNKNEPPNLVSIVFPEYATKLVGLMKANSRTLNTTNNPFNKGYRLSYFITIVLPQQFDYVHKPINLDLHRHINHKHKKYKVAMINNEFVYTLGLDGLIRFSKIYLEGLYEFGGIELLDLILSRPYYPIQRP